MGIASKMTTTSSAFPAGNSVIFICFHLGSLMPEFQPVSAKCFVRAAACQNHAGLIEAQICPHIKGWKWPSRVHNSFIWTKELAYAGGPM
jgi:hypothetical protein